MRGGLRWDEATFGSPDAGVTGMTPGSGFAMEEEEEISDGNQRARPARPALSSCSF